MFGLLIIFLAKVVEVSLTTLRMVFVSKGERLYASSVGLVEIIIWLQVASVVLTDINEHPMKMVMYAVGFSVGNYVGLIIEEWIGLGYSEVRVISNPVDSGVMANALRDSGYAVTTTNAEGRDGYQIVSSVYIKRKEQQSVIQLINDLELDTVITVSETQKVYGGFGLK